MVPFSVCDGGEWDYDYSGMNDAFNGIDTWQTSYPDKPIISVEYAPMRWNGYSLTASRLACLEASLSRMYDRDVGWCYWRISQTHSGSDDILIPTDPFELNHDLRDLLVQYLPPSVSFQSFQDGFEDGNSTFPNWSSITTSDGVYSVTSGVKYQGSYSANLSTTASGANDYTRIEKDVQGISAIYTRSWVMLPEFPDTNGTEISLLRFRNSTYSGSVVHVAVLKHATNGSFGWKIWTPTNQYSRYSQPQTPNNWFSLELYFKSGASSVVTLWVNDILVCNETQDLSAYGNVARCTIQCFLVNEQTSTKTVFHDSVVISKERIGMGTPTIFGSAMFSAYGNEPIEGVTINGTYTTDSSGFYEWKNLTYGINIFVVEPPLTYYPAWCVNVEGSFSWNGTHYILSHNITEKQTEYLELYFYSTQDAYVVNASSKLTSLSISDSEINIVTSGACTLNVNVTYRLEPTSISFDGVPQTKGDTWNYSGQILTVTTSGTDILVFWGSMYASSQSPSNALVYGSNFGLQFYEGDSLALCGNYPLIFEVQSGFWNGSSGATTVYADRGRFSFYAENDTVLEVSCPDAPSGLDLSVSGASYTQPSKFVWLVTITTNNTVTFTWN